MAKEMTVKYKFADDYNPLYVNGAWGGVAGTGEIVANFYHERMGLPKESQASITEKGALIDTAVTDPEGHQQIIVRYIQTGIVMNLEAAKRVHAWLGDKIAFLEKARSGEKP
jgi:hypothetical protein